MKAHTTEGDKLLDDTILPQDDPLMRTAHEILPLAPRALGRPRLSRRTGKATISPSRRRSSRSRIAYDALTSERCYKKAFPTRLLCRRS